MMRKLAAEFLGTAILVFFAAGVATLMFGFKLAGASRPRYLAHAWPGRSS
jgi:aquaporin Z